MQKVDGRESLYRLKNGETVYFQSSKVHDYKSYGATWQSIKLSTFEKFDIYCQIIGYEGIVVMPKNALEEYSKVSTSILYDRFHFQFKIWPKLSSITTRGSVFAYRLENFFIPISYNESIIIDEIYDESLEETIAKALEFKDHEIQYADGFEMTHRRIESKAQKERVAKIEDHKCQICGYSYEYKNKAGASRWIIEVDHITEKSAGGGETIDNMLVLCPNCHAKKTYGAITLNPDFTYTEKGITQPLRTNKHLGIFTNKK